MIQACGHLADSANYPQWRARLYPFRDRPDLGINVIWQAVPADRPAQPASPFVGRFWDFEDGWRRMEAGSGDYSEWQVFPGALPVPPLGPLGGTEEDWAEGCSHAAYLAGEVGHAECTIDLRMHANLDLAASGSAWDWCDWQILGFPNRWEIIFVVTSGAGKLDGVVATLVYDAPSNTYVGQAVDNFSNVWDCTLACDEGGWLEAAGSTGEYVTGPAHLQTPGLWQADCTSTEPFTPTYLVGGFWQEE